MLTAKACTVLYSNVTCTDPLHILHKPAVSINRSIKSKILSLPYHWLYSASQHSLGLILPVSSEEWAWWHTHFSLAGQSGLSWNTLVPTAAESKTQIEIVKCICLLFVPLSSNVIYQTIWNVPCMYIGFICTKTFSQSLQILKQHFLAFFWKTNYQKVHFFAVTQGRKNCKSKP